MAAAVCYRRALLPAAETRLPAAPVRQRCRPCSLLLLRRGLPAAALLPRAAAASYPAPRAGAGEEGAQVRGFNF